MMGDGRYIPTKEQMTKPDYLKQPVIQNGTLGALDKSDPDKQYLKNNDIFRECCDE